MYPWKWCFSDFILIIMRHLSNKCSDLSHSPLTGSLLGLSFAIFSPLISVCLLLRPAIRLWGEWDFTVRASTCPRSSERLSQQHVKTQVSKPSMYHWSHSSTGLESHRHYKQTLDFKVQKVNFSFIKHKYLHNYMFTVQHSSFQQNCCFSPVYYSLQTMHWKHLLWIMLIISLHGSFAVFWQVFDLTPGSVSELSQDLQDHGPVTSHQQPAWIEPLYTLAACVSAGLPVNTR